MRTRSDDDDDDDIVRDGESVRCPVLLMDSVQREVAAFDFRGHQPHFVSDATNVRRISRDARTEMIERAQEAWKSGGAVSLADAADGRLRAELLDAEESQRRRNAAWQEYRTRLAS